MKNYFLSNLTRSMRDPLNWRRTFQRVRDRHPDPIGSSSRNERIWQVENGVRLARPAGATLVPPLPFAEKRKPVSIRRVAVILPSLKRDFLAETVLDGLNVSRRRGEIESCIVSDDYPIPDEWSDALASPNTFVPLAREADAVLFVWGKKRTNFELAQAVGCWGKTAFIDGSEPGGDRRFNPRIQRAILRGDPDTEGAINIDMLKRCAAYFRRELPVIPGIYPLPFGIEQRFLASYREGTRKDIDFFCIFGQDKHPKLRRKATDVVRGFCDRRGFTCATDRVSQEEYYDLLARSKVGISIGGGGFDTARFWEMLGNNCMILTERINLLPPHGTSLSLKRIFEFGDLSEFTELLARVADFLRDGYDEESLADEYQQVLAQHSTAARARYILQTLSVCLARR